MKKEHTKSGFKPHNMFDKNGKAHRAKTHAQHLVMKARGFTHTKPSSKKSKDY